MKNKKMIISIVVIGIILVGVIIFIYLRQPVNIKAISFGNISLKDGKYKDSFINDKKEYEELLNYYKVDNKNKNLDFSKNRYLVIIPENDYCGGKINGIRNVKVTGKNITVEIGIDASCGPCVPEYELYLLPLIKDQTLPDYHIKYNYKTENNPKCDNFEVLKPIIYLYPTEKIHVNVKLVNKNSLTTTYPKYQDSWNVIANPNGDLIDVNTGRYLYALYWEGTNENPKDMKEEGFIVSGKNTIDFLEEKLAILGLSEREAEEFIIYWLPKLEQNKYNYIRFQTIEEINEYMPLEINPQPDTIIRIMMEYKSLNKKIPVREQELKAPKRTGFTVVEWGGTKLK